MYLPTSYSNRLQVLKISSIRGGQLQRRNKWVKNKDLKKEMGVAESWEGWYDTSNKNHTHLCFTATLKMALFRNYLCDCI